MVIQSHKQIFYKGIPQKAAYLGSDFVWPKEMPEEPAPIDYSEPFYVENTKSDSHVTWITPAAHYYGYGQMDWDLYVSRDKVNWTLAYEFKQRVSGQQYEVRLSPGEKLYMKAENKSLGAWYQPDEASFTFFYGTHIKGCSKVGGNILSLFYGFSFNGTEKEFPEDAVNGACQLIELFWGNDALVDASKLIIPVKTLHPCSCKDMFYECTNLIYPPVCEFDTFVDTPYIYDEGRVTRYCNGMFYGCNNLAYVPDAVKNAPR